MEVSNVLLRTEKLSKEFDHVRVLSDIDFDLRAGEIHALIGENGAGKSTFVKILSGVYQPTSGSCWMSGEKVAFRAAKDSEEAGIFTIHQEINLVPYFNAYQNIFIGNERRNRFGLLKDREMAKKAEEVLSRLNIHLDVHKPVMYFNTSLQRIVQISSALVYEPKILIFDEPSTALGEEERKRLLQIIKDLRDTGIGIIFISHNIEEIIAISDRATVFKDGCKVGTLEKDEIESHRIVSMMIGNQDYEVYVRERKGEVQKEVLRVEHLTTSKLKDVTFSLHKGEILGVVGVIGAGKSEIARAIFGIDKLQKGNVVIGGKCNKPHCTASITRGLALVPEERRMQGLVPSFTVAENITLAYMDRFARFSFMNRKKEREAAERHIEALSIKTTGPHQIIRYLSGGNQQKVVLSKWLSGDFDILILDEPTKGIDILAKRDIYRLINTLVEEGKSVLFMSSYLPELLNICDRILVVNDGAVTGEFSTFGPEAKEKITHTMLGGKAE
ncbi:MAG: sugar ABC transporter ATP-binding protein [Clostridiaceae bacterium]